MHRLLPLFIHRNLTINTESTHALLCRIWASHSLIKRFWKARNMPCKYLFWCLPFLPSPLSPLQYCLSSQLHWPILLDSTHETPHLLVHITLHRGIDKHTSWQSFKCASQAAILLSILWQGDRHNRPAIARLRNRSESFDLICKVSHETLLIPFMYIQLGQVDLRCPGFGGALPPRFS